MSTISSHSPVLFMYGALATAVVAAGFAAAGDVVWAAGVASWKTSESLTSAISSEMKEGDNRGSILREALDTQVGDQ